MKKKGIIFKVSAALFIIMMLAGCAGLRRAFSPANEKYKAAMNAWKSEQYADSLLLMAEAHEIDPKLPDPKMFYRDNFDTAMASIKADLSPPEKMAEHLAKEQIYDTYVDLQKIYDAMRNFDLPFTDKKKKKWEWTTDVSLDYTDEIKTARMAAWDAYFAYALEFLKNDNAAESNKAIDYALDKFEMNKTEAYGEIVSTIVDEYLSYASSRHESIEIDVLESAILAYETVLHFDENNTAAKEGYSFLSIRVSDRYVIRGQEKEAQGQSGSIQERIALLEDAASDYDRALFWNETNSQAIALKDAIKPKIAEMYYQEGIRLENSEGLDASERIVAAYEAAQEWVENYRDTNKRIFNVLVSVELEELSGNIGISRREMDELSSSFRTVSDQAGKMIGYLQDYIDLTEKIVDVNKTMKTTATVLKPMSPIPYVGSFLSGTGTYIERTREILIEKPANKMKDIQKRAVEPLKAKMESMKSFVDSVLAQFDKIDSTLASTDQFVLRIKACVEQKGDKEIFDLVETNAAKLNGEYKKFNDALIDTNDSINGITDVIGNMFSISDYMRPVKDGLNKFSAITDKFSGVTKEVDKVLNKKITVNYLFDSFSFSIMDILNGIDSVIGIVMDMLMDAAMALLNPLLDQLKIEFPEIPGLEELQQEIDKYTGYYNDIQAQLDRAKQKVDAFTQIQDRIQATLTETMQAAACQ